MATVSPIPVGYHSLSAFLLLHDIPGFLAFLHEAFDAQIVRQLTDGEGQANYAEVRMGDSHIMIGHPGEEHGPRPTTLYFYVPDADSVYAGALAAGARSISKPTDMFFGDRNAGVIDSWGNIWWIATHVEDVNEAELQRRADEAVKQLGAVNK
jgi:PhnB protein